jgi:hypothetical protein
MRNGGHEPGGSRRRSGDSRKTVDRRHTEEAQIASHYEELVMPHHAGAATAAVHHR